MITSTALLAVLAPIASVIVKSIPDLTRYLKIREM